MNTPIIGRIYHVVDKATGEVIKVGSTIQTLSRRFSDSFYKKRYTNHFLLLCKEIHSSDLDWYESGNPYCPFLWHLAASEHREILRANTFRKGPLSNKRSPLDEKYFGFDAVAASTCVTLDQMRLNGATQGKRNVESGLLTRIGSLRPLESRKLSGAFIKEQGLGIFSLTKEEQRINARQGGLAAGRLATESGQVQRLAALQKENKTGIFALGMKAKGGHISGTQNAVNGVLAKARHVHWHVNRNMVSLVCSFCQGVA